ncbi:bifunctional folylpolyglutamate synthase/dihydrofolate synthase [bacterium BMS3Abin03]|nr:bifunctional folylpolyglutamate synthase/dihydrofolate synthase [bacterium BMS3Abin03]MCG6960395.1 bifunctional folylpolyglutamate synthase/dihydrofolate synthase [bacterium BMS3Abin03]
MDINSALEKLFKLHTFGVKLGLDNVKHFLDHIDNPQRNLKAIHIAGSNGKGSTAAFIASILMEYGYKTGLYTSPHFVKFNERITINGEQIDNEYVAGFITEHWSYITEHALTFFEVTSALAFEYFSNSKVDYAIIETGLGGRLDATNVLNSIAVVITSISLEHTNVLGTEISVIAKEKAAIIKQGTKVFIGLLDPEADAVVERKCNEENCELFRLQEYINEKDDRLELYTEEIELDEWNVPLRGKYQVYNSALAVLVVSNTFVLDDNRKITHGISNVIKNTGIEGRFEYLHKGPDIILDSAHNIAGVREFLSEFNKSAGKYQRKVLLFGVMRDKAIEQMLIELGKSFDEIHLTQIDNERSAKIDELKKICFDIKIDALEEPVGMELINKFLKSENKDCLVVLGSMYLLGEVKSKLQ